MYKLTLAVRKVRKAYKKRQIVGHVVKQSAHHRRQVDDMCRLMFLEQCLRLGVVTDKID